MIIMLILLLVFLGAQIIHFIYNAEKTSPIVETSVEELLGDPGLAFYKANGYCKLHTWSVNNQDKLQCMQCNKTTAQISAEHRGPEY